MNMSINGNKFTLSITFTIFKAVIFLLTIGAVICLPYYFLELSEKRNSALEKILADEVASNLSKKKLGYVLSSDEENVLYSWITYGLNNGRKKMIQTYIQQTKNQDIYKPFLHIIETEWKNGNWESVSVNAPSNSK